jgi:hypothetical protein
MSWLASLLLHVVTLCRQYASYGASIIPVNLAITPHGYESTCLLPKLRNHSFLDRDIDLYAHRHTHTKTHVSVASTNNTYINAINCKRTISSLIQVCLYMFVLQASCLANLSGFSKTKVLGFDVLCPWDTKSSWCSPAVAPDGHLVQDTAGGKSGSPETYTTRSWEVDSNSCKYKVYKYMSII